MATGYGIGRNRILLIGALAVIGFSVRSWIARDSAPFTVVSPEQTRAEVVDETLPELHFSEILVSPEHPRPEDDVTITFRYVNTGADITHSVALYAYNLGITPPSTRFSGSRKRQAIISTLTNNQSGELVVEYGKAVDGAYLTCAVIDVWEEAQEQNELIESNRKCVNVLVGSGESAPAAFIPEASSIPTNLRPGQTFQATIAMQNNTNDTWTSNGYQLQNIDWSQAAVVGTPRQIWGSASEDINRTESVRLATRATFVLTGLQAPRTEGIYHFRWRMAKIPDQFPKEERFGDTVDVTILVSNQAPEDPLPSPELPPVDPNILPPDLPPLLPPLSTADEVVPPQQDPPGSADFTYSLTPTPASLGKVQQGGLLNGSALLALETGQAQPVELSLADDKEDVILGLPQNLITGITKEPTLVIFRIQTSPSTSTGSHTVRLSGKPGDVSASYTYIVEGTDVSKNLSASPDSSLQRDVSLDFTASVDTTLPPLAPAEKIQQKDIVVSASKEAAVTPVPPKKAVDVPVPTPSLPPLVPSVTVKPTERADAVTTKKTLTSAPSVLVKLNAATVPSRLLYAGTSNDKPIALIRYTLSVGAESVELKRVTGRFTRNGNVARAVLVTLNDHVVGSQNGVPVSIAGQFSTTSQKKIILPARADSILTFAVRFRTAPEILSGREFEITLAKQEQELKDGNGKSQRGINALLDLVGVESQLPPAWVNDQGNARGSVAMSPTYQIFDSVPVVKVQTANVFSKTPQVSHTVFRFYAGSSTKDILINNLEFSNYGTCRVGGSAGAQLADPVSGDVLAAWSSAVDWLSLPSMQVEGKSRSAGGWKKSLTLHNKSFRTLDLSIDTSNCQNGETVAIELGGKELTASGFVWYDQEYARSIDSRLPPVSSPLKGPIVKIIR